MRIVLAAVAIAISGAAHAQDRVTAGEWEPQARQLAADAAGGTSFSAPSGIRPAPAPGDSLLVDPSSGAASGWQYTYAFGEYDDIGGKQAAIVTMVSGRDPEVYLGYSAFNYNQSMITPLPSGWPDSDVFLAYALDHPFPGGWSLRVLLETYDDAEVYALAAYGGARNSPYGDYHHGTWEVDAWSPTCRVYLSVKGFGAGGSWPGPGVAVGACFPVGTEEEGPLSRVSLNAVFPNPVVDHAAISFSLASPSDASLEVADVLGRIVAVIADGAFSAGDHVAFWEAGDVPSGIYVVRFASGGAVHSRRVVVVR